MGTPDAPMENLNRRSEVLSDPEFQRLCEESSDTVLNHPDFRVARIVGLGLLANATDQQIKDASSNARLRQMAEERGLDTTTTTWDDIGSFDAKKLHTKVAFKFGLNPDTATKADIEAAKKNSVAHNLALRVEAVQLGLDPDKTSLEQLVAARAQKK